MSMEKAYPQQPIRKYTIAVWTPGALTLILSDFFKVRLFGALSNLLWMKMSLLTQAGSSRRPLKFSSSDSNSAFSLRKKFLSGTSDSDSALSFQDLPCYVKGYEMADAPCRDTGI